MLYFTKNALEKGIFAFVVLVVFLLVDEALSFNVAITDSKY